MNEFDDLLKEMLGANFREESSEDDEETWLWTLIGGAAGIEPARMFINSITYRLAVTALCQKSLDTIATALVNIGHPARVSLQSLLKTLMSHLP